MAESSSPNSHWHTVRPWSPRFLLTVREITSVSTTFVLSSTCSNDGFDAGLSSLGINPVGFDDEDALEDTLGAATSSASLVSDALGRGLSVNVNGAAWKRVLMRMDEAGDEAIIVLYGLMPGRQYDVELGIVFGNGEEVVHSRMVTQSQQQQGQASPDDVGDSSIDSTSSSFSSVSSACAASTTTTASAPRSITIEEYAAQLRAQLAHLGSERESVSAQLKTARREAHKTDAAKRSEIEALKRSAEKHATAETRGRQKARALQEAAKQAAAAAREAEESALKVEAALPALRARAGVVVEQHKGVTKEAERSREEADEALRADRKRTADLQAELGSLTTRLEKLQARRERLSGDTLPELEAQLARVIREVELVERDANAFEVIDKGPVGFDLATRTGVAGHAGMSRPASNSDSFSLSTTPISSPPAPISRQAVQILNFPFNNTSNGNGGGGGGSTLSSRAPPFDPGPAFGARLGSAFQLQHASALGVAALRPPMLGAKSSSVLPSSPDGSSHAFAHTHTQSWDTGGPHTNLPVSPGAAGAGKRPLSPGPVRQTSLPVRMPSYVNAQTAPPR
ncbi:hypothetical protein DFH11DRAFT_1709039 [Phellopilus nigrolimitatus]|nr:hypothetical protein DFH11DRAFT_1709039 [Phellopilus nigrolimitatus]